MRVKKYLSRFFSSINGRTAPPVFKFSGQKSGTAAIVSEGESASITYLIEPHVTQSGFTPRTITWAERHERVVCSIVIISRYLPRGWEDELSRFSKSGGKVVYFMDDDLLDSSALAGLSSKYSKKILQLAVRKRRDLEKICSEFWVSSAYLFDKYSALSPRLLTPQKNCRNQLEIAESCTVCYHGTSSHRVEIDWLLEIVSALQQSHKKIHFEIFGDHAVNREYREIPRTSVLHPMSWPNYFAYTSSVRREIALAPLLPTPFNAGRGATKFFDFTRMGAVGIYSDVEPYRSFIRNGIDGILLPNIKELWLKTIVEIAADTPRRTRMLAAAQARLQSPDGNPQKLEY